MHDCPCCGEAVYSNTRELCSCCKKADCDASGDDCQIPCCSVCETRYTFCTDGQWHDNCDDVAVCAEQAET